MFGAVPRQLQDVVASGTLRSGARDYAEQSLLARFELTSYLRACAPLASRGAEADEPFRVWWFKHGIFGVSTGLVEGIQLPNPGIVAGEDQSADWARRLLVDRDARIVAANTLLQPDRAAGDASVHKSEDVRSHGHLLEKQYLEQYNDILPLGATYDASLARLGRHTRRNLRKFTKEIASQGVRFSFFEERANIATSEVYSLAQNNRPCPLPVRRIKKYERYVATAGGGFRSVLVDKDGRLISYCLGFTQGTSAYVVLQLNHTAWHARSPSLVHRGHLMEAMVNQGKDRIVFVHGCAGILAHSCLPTFVRRKWLMRSDVSTRILTTAATKVLPGGYHQGIAQQLLQQSRPFLQAAA